MIIYTNSENYCNNYINPSVPEDCHNKLSQDEIKNDIIYCCYLVVDDNISCQGLTQEDYDEIPANVITAEKNFFYYRIECFSINIGLSFISLIFLFY